MDGIRTRLVYVSAAVLLATAAGAGVAVWWWSAGVEAQSARTGRAESRTVARYAVHVRVPESPPRVDTGRVDAKGRPVLVACGTCHATREPNRTIASSDALRDFHTELRVAHGNRSCLSCHNAEDYDTLRLADGTALAWRDVKALCAQCHGPQHRDYEHGSHGGMNGYWDLTRGPRTRNTCTDCHDPHAPRYPQVLPAPGPRDRFLRAGAHDGGEHHE